MATKKVLGDHAISTLKEQVRRFETMSVCLVKGADLATRQANDISEWISKLINTLTLQDSYPASGPIARSIPPQSRSLSLLE